MGEEALDGVETGENEINGFSSFSWLTQLSIPDGIFELEVSLTIGGGTKLGNSFGGDV